MIIYKLSDFLRKCFHIVFRYTSGGFDIFDFVLLLKTLHLGCRILWLQKASDAWATFSSAFETLKCKVQLFQHIAGLNILSCDLNYLHFTLSLLTSSLQRPLFLWLPGQVTTSPYQPEVYVPKGEKKETLKGCIPNKQLKKWGMVKLNRLFFFFCFLLSKLAEQETLAWGRGEMSISKEFYMQKIFLHYK